MKVYSIDWKSTYVLKITNYNRDLEVQRFPIDAV